MVLLSLHEQTVTQHNAMALIAVKNHEHLTKPNVSAH